MIHQFESTNYDFSHFTIKNGCYENVNITSHHLHKYTLQQASTFYYHNGIKKFAADL